MFGTQALLAALSTPFKRSQFGLFHGKMRQSGNNVPFSKHKTKRTWLPNVQQKRLHSDVLGETVKLKLTTRALKTIKKVSRSVRAFTGSVSDGARPCAVRWPGHLPAEYEDGFTGSRRNAVTRFDTRTTEPEGTREPKGGTSGTMIVRYHLTPRVSMLVPNS